VARERETELDRLDRQVATLRRSLDDLRADLARADRQLLGQVMLRRDQAGAGHPVLAAAFLELDTLLVPPTP
jgi:hypothetical protein